MKSGSSRAPWRLFWLEITVFVACGVVLLVTALTLGTRLRGGDAASFTARNRNDAALKEPLWRVPPFRFESQRGSPVSSEELSGHVWIANFVFTTCTNVCPMMSSKLILLQRALSDPALRFVSFSVDPQHDTAAVLSAYAKRWNGGDPRWLLLRPTPQELSAFAQDMRVPCDQTGDPDNPMTHSGLFFLIDKALQVRAVYDPDDRDALAQIRRDVGRLSGAQPGSQDLPMPPSAPAVASGEQLYLQLGCDGCHHSPRIAPRLDAIWGQEVTFADGTKRSVDDDYVRESILQPGAHLVQGYAALMPSYQDKVSPVELASLIAYLHARSRTCTGDCSAERPTRAAVDPICKMAVVVTPETPKAERDGVTHYFCSEHCRLTFIRTQESARGRP